MYERGPEQNTSLSKFQRVGSEIGRIAVPGTTAGAIMTIGANDPPEKAFPLMFALATGAEVIRKFVLEPLRYN